jgi:transposase InsO family protein
MGVNEQTLGRWDRGFDDAMHPLEAGEKRGRPDEVTLDEVKRIVGAARELKAKGERIRLDSFTKLLETAYDITRSRQTVSEILIGNNLYQPQTRKRRPGFYQSLRRCIPNGLLSIDGSDFTVWLGEKPYRFNVELSVDVESFCHTAFSVSETETTGEFIKVMEAHKDSWGAPLGLVSDHGSANLSDDACDYLDNNEIDPIPAGPGNPKGNGSAESAFSGMSEMIGSIRLDISSMKALAKSVLQFAVSLYVKMRNRLCRIGDRLTPGETMSMPVSREDRTRHRKKYKERTRKRDDDSGQRKLDRLDFLISNHHLEMDQRTMKRARKCILHYDLEAITQSEHAFLNAVNRDPNRCSIAYFFGILKRIQQQRDDAHYQQYCRSRYHYQQMREREREKEKETTTVSTTVKAVTSLLQQAGNTEFRFLQKTCITQAHAMLDELKTHYRYMGALKAKFSEHLGGMSELTIGQRQEIWKLVEGLLNVNPGQESVT